MFLLKWKLPPPASCVLSPAPAPASACRLSHAVCLWSVPCVEGADRCWNEQRRACACICCICRRYLHVPAVAAPTCCKVRIDSHDCSGWFLPAVRPGCDHHVHLLFRFRFSRAGAGEHSGTGTWKERPSPSWFPPTSNLAFGASEHHIAQVHAAPPPPPPPTLPFPWAAPT